MVGRTNTGGGGSGGTLTITGVAGSTVVASKDGKSYTRILNSSGKAVFKGLSTGTWTVTMSNASQTATRTIVITADYALTIAYFSATINITYPANSTCKVTDSNGATIASDTNTGSSTKTWTATVNATGTYTITATKSDSSKTKSTTATITTEGQVATVKLAYELLLFDNGIVNDIKWDANNRSGNGNANDSTSSVSNKISLIAYGYWDSNYCSADATRGTSDSFDLSTYSTLKIQVSAASSFGQRQVYIGTTSLKHDVATMNISNTGTVACDISAINSQCFVSFYVSTRGQNEAGTATLDVTKVWLE